MSAYFLREPGIISPRIAPPSMNWDLPYQLLIKNMSFPSAISYVGSSSIEVTSFQVTVICVKLT